MNKSYICFALFQKRRTWIFENQVSKTNPIPNSPAKKLRNFKPFTRHIW